MSTTSASNPTSPDMSADPLNAILAQNWWAVALRGYLVLHSG
jgi:hypothetical protein